MFWNLSQVQRQILSLHIIRVGLSTAFISILFFLLLGATRFDLQQQTEKLFSRLLLYIEGPAYINLEQTYFRLFRRRLLH
jgi:hypothetical protein